MILNLLGAAALAVALLPLAASAQDVTLSSADGGLRVSGDLLAWDGQFLRLQTEFGPLTLDARRLDCAGPGCPMLNGAIAESIVAGSPSAVAEVLPILLAGFAAGQGLQIETRMDGPAVVYDLSDPHRDGLAIRLRVLAMAPEPAVDALMAGMVDLVLSPDPPGDGARGQIVAVQPLVPLRASGGQITLADLLAVLDGRAGGVHLPADLALAPPVALTAEMRPHDDMTGLLRSLLEDPDAVGLVGAGGHTAAVTGQLGAFLVSVADGCAGAMDRGRFAVRLGAWPLTQPIHAVHRAERLPLHLRQLLSHAESEPAAQALRAAGLVDPLLEPMAPAAMLDRLLGVMARADAQMPAGLLPRIAALARGGAPLSLAIRFDPGTTRISARSQPDLERLVDLARQGRFDGHTLTFVGFSAAPGVTESDLRQTRRLAEAAQQAFLQALPVPAPDLRTQAHGLGGLMPLVCDAGGQSGPGSAVDVPDPSQDAQADWLRGVNERVEVWLY